MTEINTSALAFALLINGAPELTEARVNEAYRAVQRAASSGDREVISPDIEGALNDVMQSRTDIEWDDLEEPDLVAALALPVERRAIVRPDRKVSAGEMQTAVDRWLGFAHRLPNFASWDDRQAVWNLVPGSRQDPVPVTGCNAAYEARRAA